MASPPRSRAARAGLALATSALVTLALAPPAAAASDWLRYDGASLNMARVPAEVVTIDAISLTPAESATYSVDGRVLATDTTLEPEGDRWVASTEVDLTGDHGLTKLTVRFEADRRSRSVTKYFRAIPPPAPDPSSTPAALPDDLPGPDTTGVPAGTALTPSGPLNLWRDGTVVDGLDVDGCVTVSGDDVTIRNTRIRCASPSGGVAVRRTSGTQRLTLEHVEVDGRGSAQVCVGWSDYTLRNVDLHGCADGARFGHRVIVEDSWIHDLAQIGTLHSDALQTTSASDVVVRHNTLDASAGAGGFRNAAVMLGSETGSMEVRDVLVEGNHLDGGNYALNVRGDITASGVTVRDNTFGDHTRFGPVLTPASVPLGTGNVYAATGEPVRVVAP